MRGILILTLHADLVNAMLKVINISSPETIIDAFGQASRITKALGFANTSSTRINFYHDLPKVLLTYSRHYSLTDLQIQFPKTLEDNGTHENRNKWSYKN